MQYQYMKEVLADYFQCQLVTIKKYTFKHPQVITKEM